MADKYIEIFNRINTTVGQLPARIAVLAVNFSKDRFAQKNWIDSVANPWKKTNKRKGSTLVASGRLKRSIRKISVTPSRVTIGTDVPYARAHNEGLEISGTERVRSFTRKKHRRKSHIRGGKRIKAQIVDSHKVNSFTRKYKRKFAKRQFIGKSKRLNNDIKGLVNSEINRAIRG